MHIRDIKHIDGYSLEDIKGCHIKTNMGNLSIRVYYGYGKQRNPILGITYKVKGLENLLEVVSQIESQSKENRGESQE